MPPRPRPWPSCRARRSVEILPASMSIQPNMLHGIEAAYRSKNCDGFQSQCEYYLVVKLVKFTEQDGRIPALGAILSYTLLTLVGYEVDFGIPFERGDCADVRGPAAFNEVTLGTKRRDTSLIGLLKDVPIKQSESMAAISAVGVPGTRFQPDIRPILFL